MILPTSPKYSFGFVDIRVDLNHGALGGIHARLGGGTGSGMLGNSNHGALGTIEVRFGSVFARSWWWY